MRINHVIKTDQWRSAPQIRPLRIWTIWSCPVVKHLVRVLRIRFGCIGGCDHDFPLEPNGILCLCVRAVAVSNVDNDDDPRLRRRTRPGARTTSQSPPAVRPALAEGATGLAWQRRRSLSTAEPPSSDHRRRRRRRRPLLPAMWLPALSLRPRGGERTPQAAGSGFRRDAGCRKEFSVGSAERGDAE